MAKDLRYGEPLVHDPDFKGPVHNRSCTDIIWLIIFVLFLGLWGFVGYYGIYHGDVERLLAPMDSQGRRCGLDSGVIDKKNLLFFDIIKCLSPETPITGCPTPQVCVERCPEESVLIEQQLLFNPSSINQLRSQIVCTDDVPIQTIQTMTASQALQYINEDKCVKFLLKSEPVLFRCIGDLSTLQCKDNTKQSLEPVRQTSGQTCVRDPKAGQTSLVNRTAALASYVGIVVASWLTFFTRNDFNVQVLSSQIVEDLVVARWYMVGALVGVLLICLLYIVLLRWVVAPVVWASIAGLLAVLGFSAYLCYTNYEYYLAHPVSLHQTTNLKGYAQSLFSKHQTWLTLLIAIAVLLLILTLMVIFLRNRITIAIALIKEGSKAVASITSTMAFPLFPWLFQCAVIAYGVVVLMYLLSIGTATFSVANMSQDAACNCNGVYTQEGQSCDPVVFGNRCHDTSSSLVPCRLATCHFTGIDQPTIINYMLVVNVVGFFWLLFFIGGLADLMLASTFSTWYWTFHKRDVPYFTLTHGVYRAVRYHMGTVALGSLIITIVRLIRLMLEYIDHKLKKYDNAFVRGVLCCCKCLFWCLENFLKFINKNAYIMCAVHGKNFCSSARDAFSLLMRNIVRVVVLDKVTDFIFFLSKLLISIGVGIAVYYILQWNYIYEVTQGQRLHHNYVPAIILSVATYLITTIFFNVYAMAVDTLFLCFLEDCERNDGSPEKPYFMSKNLMRILGKKNKKIQ